MAQVFLPPLDSVWRLKADWLTPPSGFISRYDNTETLWAEPKYNIENWKKATGDNTNDQSDWVERRGQWEVEQRQARGEPEFLAGTILRFDRYHISHSGTNQVTVTVLISPDKRLTPKKQGGTMRGAGRLYFTLNELNQLPELEEVNVADLR